MLLKRLESDQCSTIFKLKTNNLEKRTAEIFVQTSKFGLKRPVQRSRLRPKCSCPWILFAIIQLLANLVEIDLQFVNKSLSCLIDSVNVWVL